MSYEDRHAATDMTTPIDPRGNRRRTRGDGIASMIVAGAYGHSRFRELILGGVTQYLVTQSARCVLLSH